MSCNWVGALLFGMGSYLNISKYISKKWKELRCDSSWKFCWDKLPKIPHAIKPSSISQVVLFQEREEVKAELLKWFWETAKESGQCAPCASVLISWAETSFSGSRCLRYTDRHHFNWNAKKAEYRKPSPLYQFIYKLLPRRIQKRFWSTKSSKGRWTGSTK